MTVRNSTFRSYISVPGQSLCHMAWWTLVASCVSQWCWEVSLTIASRLSFHMPLPWLSTLSKLASWPSEPQWLRREEDRSLLVGFSPDPSICSAVQFSKLLSTWKNSLETSNYCQVRRRGRILLWTFLSKPQSEIVPDIARVFSCWKKEKKSMSIHWQNPIYLSRLQHTVAQKKIYWLR